MSGETAYKAVDAIFRSAVNHQYKKVVLKYAGGEASLQLKQVMAIHDYASQLAHQYGIQLEAILLSNGVMLSQIGIDELKRRHIDVMISLDGIGSSHDAQRPLLNGGNSFRYVMRTVERLLNNDLVPHISVTISRANLNGLPELVEYILANDMPFTLNFYRENEYAVLADDLRSGDEEMIAAMRSVFQVVERHLPKASLLGCLIDKANLGVQHRHTCGMGHSYLVIDQQGGVAKCHANIKRTITTVNAEDPLQVIRNNHDGAVETPVDQKEGCRACEWRYWCSGGCAMLTYSVTGRNDVKSPYCNVYKALFPDVLRLEALRLLHYEAPLDLNHDSRIPR